MDLAFALKQIRKFSGITLQEVCDKFNRHPYPRRKITKMILSRMEQGSYTVRAEDMMAFCDLYGLSLDTMRDVMENKKSAFDAVRTKADTSITKSFLIGDGGYQGGIISFPIGAKVIVALQAIPMNGDLVAIRSNDMDPNSAAIRKYTRALGSIILIPEDKNYPSQPLNDEITVLGVVKDVQIHDIL